MARGKAGGATMASPKERADQEHDQKQSSAQKISVRIDSLIDDPSRSLRAFASANIGDFAVHGISVYEKDGKFFADVFHNALLFRHVLFIVFRLETPFFRIFKEMFECFHASGPGTF